jgi:membrane protease YdiL (CAAX protease family)
MDQRQIEERVQEQKKWPSVLGANIVYLAVLALMMVAPILIGNQDSGTVSTLKYYLKLFLLEIILVGGPPLIYMLIFKMNIREVIRLNKIKAGEAFLVAGMAILGYGVIIIINRVWYWIISHWGTPAGQELPPVTNGSQLLLAVLTIGLVPAIVEEFLFRGLIIRGYERFGSIAAIVMTGVLFGLLHIQLMSIPSVILLGIVITYTVYRTNSIFAGIIYHFVHNTVTVCFLFLQNIVQKFAGGLEAIPEQDISALPQEVLPIAMAFWGIVGLGALALFILYVAFFHRYTEGKGQVRSMTQRELKRPAWLEMLPALVAIGFVVFLIINEVRYMMGLI